MGKVVDAIDSAANSIGHGISTVADQVGHSAEGFARGAGNAARSGLTDPFGYKTTRGAISDTLALGKQDTKALGNDLVPLIPIGIDIASAYNPYVGAGLEALYSAREGQPVGTVLKNAGAQYVGGQIGGAAGSAAGSATGSTLAGAAAGGFARGASTGLLEGKTGQQSLDAGLVGGGTAGGLDALGLSKPDTFVGQLAQGAASTGISTALSDALGLNSTPGSTSALPAGIGAGTSAAGTAAGASGSSSITGAAVDPSESGTSERKGNVWNSASLRVKDALGA